MMFNFLKRNTLDLKEKDDDIHLYALRLLIHLALSDGEIDELEINALKDFVNEKSLDSNISLYLDKEIDNVKLSSSFFNEIHEINSKLDKNKKLELLEKIWKLILVDGEIDPYEENLFYRIGDLLGIKRSILNKVRSGFS